MKTVKTCSNCETFFIPLTNLVAENVCAQCCDEALAVADFGLKDYDSEDAMLEGDSGPALPDYFYIDHLSDSG
jgi:hypothetical protein